MKDKKFNREWVKTFAIIFLSILLVLTFFSNTIMNMTLPEVSTQYIQYGTIKSQVRGSGTVLSQDSYSVTTSATREVSKVAVRQGQEVEKGQVLLYLAETESEELQAARNTLDNLNYEYTKMLIETSGNKALDAKRLELTQTEADLEETKQKLTDYQAAKALIEAAEENLKQAEKAVSKKENQIAELEAEKAAVGYTPTEEEVILGKDTEVTLEQYTAASLQLDEADKKIDVAKSQLDTLKSEQRNLQAQYDKVKREYDDINAKIEKPLDTLKEEIKTSDRDIEALEREIKYIKQEVYENKHNKDLKELYDRFKRFQEIYKDVKAQYDELLLDPDASSSEIEAAEEQYITAMENMESAYDDYDAVLTDKEVLTDSMERELAAKETQLKYALEDNTEIKKLLTETEVLDKKLNEKKVVLTSAESALYDATSKVDIAQALYDNASADKESLEKSLEKTRNGYKYVVYKGYEDKIDKEKEQLDALKDTRDQRNEELNDLKEQNTESEGALKEQIKNYERQIVTIQGEIEQAIKDAGDSEKLNQLELQRKKNEIDKATKEVEKLKMQYTVAEITSPVSGIIDSVNISSGQKTTPDASLIDISLKENGYKMTLTVTQEQAAKLRPGIQAEITSYIPYGSQITATLAAIKNDTQNPSSRQKLLEFTIDGDVQPNENLSVAVGDKNASYESTVPNTAIREDSDGKYILTVESKSTPISTRYIAKRVNVNVVASDDTRSAITGDFQNYGYVIATSTKPINDKEQVKLVEN